jgi:hypothetical protein
MKLVGFNFKKINIEKFSDELKDLKIDTKIDISELNLVRSNIFDEKERLIAVKFSFVVDYSPKIAEIVLNGVLLLSVDKKTAEEVLEDWKDKKISEDFRIPLFNIILRKSNIKALELEDELSLPLHVPLPNIKKEEKREE